MPGAVAAEALRPPAAPFHGTFFRPQPWRARRPAILVIGGSEGGDLLPRHQASYLAAAGFPALAVAYFKLPGLPEELRSVPLEYFADALSWLGAETGVDRSQLIVMGTSRGSEAVLLTGVHFPHLVGGVVAVSPGNVCLCAWPPPGPAWTLGGLPLPFVDRFGPECDNPAALIPVELIAGPILLACGGQDQTWPACSMAEAISRRLEAAGHRHRHMVLRYPDAGHGLSVMTPEIPMEWEAHPIAAEAETRARHDAWPKLLAFLDEVAPSY